MKFSIFHGSRQGPRPYNQDRLAYAYSRQALLAVLADGMGGHLHGEIAAELAAQTLISTFQRKADPLIRQPARFLTDTALQVHHQLNALRAKNGWPESPRTTLVVGLIQHNTLFCAHVGDSRLYLYRHGLVAFRTLDHSIVQSLLNAKKITPEQIASHPQRNAIYNCIGGERVPEISLSDPIPLRQGDGILLCSDGVWSAVPELHLAQAMLATTIGDAVTRVLDEAEQANQLHGDNMSVIGLQWGERPHSPFTVSTLDLPVEMTTTLFTSQGRTAALSLTDDEIERAIAEIQQALAKSASI